MGKHRPRNKKYKTNKATRNGKFTEQELMQDKEQHEHKNRNKKEPLKALNDKQEKYIKAIRNNELIVVLGPAGTGKTFIPCTMAADMFLSQRIKSIVLARPTEGPGKAIGTLPGDLNDKLLTWYRPLVGTIKGRMGDTKFNYNLKAERIELCALNQIKGRSFDNTFLIIDEAEDMDIETIKSLTTRIGLNNKIIINGDIKQKHIRQESGLGWLIHLLKKYKTPIPIIEFDKEDCVRGPLTKMFLDIFDLEEEEKHDNT